MTIEPKTYLRDVFGIVMEQSDENSSVIDDLKGVGWEYDLKRSALDVIIKEVMPKEMLTIIDAMRIAGITPEQTATVISIMGFRSNKIDK